LFFWSDTERQRVEEIWGLSGVVIPNGTETLRITLNTLGTASEASPIECYGGERGAMSAFVLTTMLEGIPLIYSSQEVAYPRSLNFFNYGVIDLKSNEVFAQEMAEIIRAYKATSSVRGGELEVYTTGDVASFYRAAGSHGMLVMVNTANESVQVKVPMEHAGKTMTDVIAGVDVELPTVMTMEPYQYFIYQQ
jgi:alpha-amylase